MGLVDYPSDSGSETSSSPDRRRSPAPLPINPKKRKTKTLPSLPSAYQSAFTAPGDDPNLHQGRSRSRPFVSGEYNVHIFLSLDIPKQLRETLEAVITKTQSQLPNHVIHSFLISPSRSIPPSKADLHVSLTHPLPLRRSQIPSFLADLKRGISIQKPSLVDGGQAFRLSFVPRLKVYENGQRTGGEGQGGRAFLAMRVGAGAVQLESLLDRIIHPILAKLHLPLYHKDPEFHASVAWCLVEPEGGEHQTSESFPDDVQTEGLCTRTYGYPINPEIVRMLNEEFMENLLARQPKGGWPVDALDVKVGKEVTRITI